MDGVKRVLCIGINKYPNLPPERQLKGCVRDVELMVDVLTHLYGFTDVVKIIDEQATRENILNNLTSLCDRTEREDVVVVYYSGHGSRMKDPLGRKPTGYYEGLVPHNGRNSEGPPIRDILDEEIRSFILNLTNRTNYVNLIFDSCHSGGISREAFGPEIRAVEPDSRSPTDEELEWLHSLTPKSVAKPGGFRELEPLSNRYVLIAASHATEPAWEYIVRVDQNTSVMHGALTYLLCQELQQITGTVSYRDIFERLCIQLAAVQPYWQRQSPQLVGAFDREVFGIKNIETSNFLSVTKRGGNVVILSGGVVHGVTKDSIWVIYPTNTKVIDEAEKELGRVRIAEVESLSSRAEILEEIGEIQPMARAFEEQHSYQHKYFVDIQVPKGFEKVLNELTAKVQTSSLLQFAEESSVEDARIYLLDKREKVQEGTLVPQLGPLEEPVWAVVQNGQLTMPVKRVNDKGAIFTICDNLEKAARYRNALQIRNPDSKCSLIGKAQVKLQRLSSENIWEDVKPDPDLGLVTFREGERCGLEITNNFERSVFVYVLDFGLSGTISQLHPIPGDEAELVPDHTLKIGIDPGDKIEFHFPENASPGLECGLGVFKVFITVAETNFTFLTQTGYRQGGKIPDSPLEELLAGAFTGYKPRDIRRTRVPTNKDWYTIEFPFYLRRREV